jgi:hypothetical protein
VGIFLVLLAIANLLGLVFIDIEALISPLAVVARYSFMLIAGIGMALLRKWGVFVYLGSLGINWIIYFAVYDGQGSAGPLWLTLPVPLGICILSYFTWSRLK